ncbi:MAG: hypothetical protein JWP35_4813 [Caulobacter sp.]|nr:hypothetical protein [Caulobacter sp.]
MSWVRTITSTALVGALSAALAGCAFPTADPKAEALAKGVYDQLRKGDDAAIEAEMSPQYRTPVLKAQLAEMRAMIPPGEPTSVKQTGWHFNTDLNRGDDQGYTYAYSYPDRTVTADVVVTRPKGSQQWFVNAFHVNTELTQAPAAPPVSASPPTMAAPKKAP